MAKKSHHRQAQRLVSQAAKVQAATTDALKAMKTGDSFVNFGANVGFGAGSQQDGSRFNFDFISRNRVNLEAAYRSNWVCGMAVDAVPEDMTRAGVEISSTMPPDDIEKITAALENLKIWTALRDTSKWARLYGGAVAFMMIDGQKPETPLRLDTIAVGQFKGLFVLDRWMLQPTLNNLITDYGPDLGKPKFYDVVADSQGLARQRIHHSRVIRLEGLDLPYWQRIAENGWAQSVLERVYDRIVAFDSTTEGTAQLVYKAHLRTMAIDGLRDIVATGGKALAGLTAQMDMVRRYQTNEGLTLIDGKDTFETHAYTFAGLDNVLLQFAQQISGALQIPMVRLFGQSPAGLNSSGDSDLKTYYDKVSARQETELRPGMTVLLDVMCRSVLGAEPPEGFAFNFRPLWLMSDKEKADVAKTITDAVVAAEGAALISQKTALLELRQASHLTGVFSNITDEDIEAAEGEPPKPDEMGLDPVTGEPIDPTAAAKPGDDKPKLEAVK